LRPGSWAWGSTGVPLGVEVWEAFAVGVGVAAPPSVRTRTGGFADSRLARLIAVALPSTRANSTGMPVATAEVTSTLVHVAETNAPLAPMPAPIAGALPNVIDVSAQLAPLVL
jgi:hypothetical protein